MKTLNSDRQQVALIMLCMQAHILIFVFICKQCLSEVRNPPKFVCPDKDTVLYIANGANIVLNCSATGQPTPRYGWTRNGRAVKPSRYIYWDLTAGTLTISNFSRAFAAVYRCRATIDFDNGLLGFSKAISLSPSIDLLLIFLESFAGSGVNIIRQDQYDYLSIPCGDRYISQGPNITYEWYYARTKLPIPREHRIFVDKYGIIYFMYVNVSDGAASIICGISTWIGHTKLTNYGPEYLVQVNPVNISHVPQVPPKFTYSTNNSRTLRLSHISLECFFSGLDMLNSTVVPLTWRRTSSGKEITNSDKYSLSDDGRRLTIMNVSMDDEGAYDCVASNSYGESARTILLHVNSKPAFLNGPPADLTVIQGKEAEFTCDARSLSHKDPARSPVWYINGEWLGYQYDKAKFIVTQENKILTVMNVQKATDIMCVQCEVRNNVGSVFASACLNVLLPITIMSMPPRIQWVYHGEKINLTVKATTDPDVQLNYRWEFQNETYGISNVPPHYIRHSINIEMTIDTQMLTEAQFESIAGVYHIIVYHSYETKVVETEVILVDQPPTTNETTTITHHLTSTTLPGSTTEPASIKSSDIMLPVIAAIIILIALILLLIVRKMCAQKRGKTNEEGEVYQDVNSESEETTKTPDTIEDNHRRQSTSVDPAQR